MTPGRWREIEKLYHSAREHGPAVLDGTDPELRREVERLLAQESGRRILDRPVAELIDATTLTHSVAGAQFDLVGQTISHYKVLAKLGAGGMGVVYKASDAKLERLVALKFLPPRLSHDDELRTRLSDEARAASALDHPNIVVVHDIGETPGGDLFIVMAFHDGVTLREKIRAGLPVREALQIARQIASGLSKAHEHGILHRDIKPSNIIVAKDGIARIIDFGLAKSGDATATADGSARGTPLYMSPEQASGKAIDFRTDLWSLGVVLYEMLAGKPPFRGDSQLQVMRAVVQEDPPQLSETRPDLPAQIDDIVARALQKDSEKRYQSAAEMVSDLSAALAALETPTPRRLGLRAIYAIPAAALILVAAAVSVWFYQRAEKQHWAREQAIPQIANLTNQNKPLAAFRLMREAQKYLRGDPQLAQIADDLTYPAAVRSTPAGASVEIKDYLSPGDPWFALGNTPLENIRLPKGYLRWRVSKAGVGEYLAAPVTQDIQGYFHEFNFALDAAATAPEGMVAVPAVHQFESLVWSLGDFGPYDLPAFYIDRFEVTNHQYQDFVDQGGYRKRDYWRERFIRDRKELTWEQAMDIFRDSTGRPGPSTWAAGHYPAGQEDYPVGGVSWYEASAYAQFAGKSLPVIAQWFLAAPNSVAKYTVQQSNFSLSAPAPVGNYAGIGPWGTYDMAGNVGEWCRNEAGGNSRYLLGGAWNTSSAEYWEPGVLPPFDRSSNSGFRCVRNTVALPVEVTAERRQTLRDFMKAKPASDEIFRVYKTMYAYDHTPLNAKVESTHEYADWSVDKITLDAAYGSERMATYLFLPAHVQPPYQTVVFFPSARVLGIPSSATLGDMKFVDYVIQSGRAVLYPVYKGTYERPAAMPEPNSVTGRETMIDDSKDIGRSIDYLETRGDIDRSKIGYLGVSMGAAQGVIFTAVEDRLKAVVFLDGGFGDERPLPGTDQVDFAPRLKTPTLMIGGRYDWIFQGKDALFRMLGTPAADKRVVTFETAHDVSEQRTDLIREVTAWLNKYFGQVR
jgi:dienelactone hydrolase